VLLREPDGGSSGLVDEEQPEGDAEDAPPWICIATSHERAHDARVRRTIREGGRAADRFILAYLVVQIALPLAYYAGLRAPTDERFAWRMFSAVRLDRCEVEVSEKVRGGAAETIRKLPLQEIVQEAWIHELERGQPRVVDRLLRRACEDAQVREVTFSRRCRAIDGTAEPPEDVVRACGVSP
jgi:hypothetical protein